MCVLGMSVVSFGPRKGECLALGLVAMAVAMSASEGVACHKLRREGENDCKGGRGEKKVTTRTSVKQRWRACQSVK